MKHLLIINGNPDPSPERLSSALAKAYREAAEGRGCLVRQINVGAWPVPPLTQAAEFLSEPTDKHVIEAQGAFLAANHIVFIFPLWLGGPPSALKAFMERVGCGGFLLEQGGRGFPRGRLSGRSARVIVTMGMPPAIYRLFYRAHGVKAFNRSILGLAGIGPVATTYFGGAEITAPGSDRTIKAVRKLGEKLA